MKKSLIIIMGLLVGALLYGELLSDEYEPTEESYLMKTEEAFIDENDLTPPINVDEGCDCRESEDDECGQEDCTCECHEHIEIE